MEHIPSNLKEYRENAGLSQEALANAVGISRKTIMAMESEEGADPKISTVRRLLTYFKITYEELYKVKR